MSLLQLCVHDGVVGGVVGSVLVEEEDSVDIVEVTASWRRCSGECQLQAQWIHVIAQYGAEAECIR